MTPARSGPPERPVPLSRAVGRAAGRWWRRNGPAVRRATGPARASWAVTAAYGWFAGYFWVGLLLAAGAARLSTGSAVLTTVVAMGGAVVLGAWQARYRIARNRAPATARLDGFGRALAVWLGLLAVGVWIQA